MKATNSKSAVYNLYLYNDSINSFDRIVNVLSKVLDWSVYQSEQCALIAHEKDRTILKRGSYHELKQQSNLLRKAGITATLEPIANDI
jgi:ATP-dependent Clp protease adapter protein ClpS